MPLKKKKDINNNNSDNTINKTIIMIIMIIIIGIGDGPRIDPCGTPYVIVLFSERVSLICDCCLWLK